MTTYIELIRDGKAIFTCTIDEFLKCGVSNWKSEEEALKYWAQGTHPHQVMFVSEDTVHFYEDDPSFSFEQDFKLIINSVLEYRFKAAVDSSIKAL